MRLAPAEHHLARHARLRDKLRAAALDALIVTPLPNIAYLTGLFASTAALLVSQDGADGRQRRAGRPERDRRIGRKPENRQGFVGGPLPPGRGGATFGCR